MSNGTADPILHEGVTGKASAANMFAFGAIVLIAASPKVPTKANATTVIGDSVLSSECRGHGHKLARLDFGCRLGSNWYCSLQLLCCCLLSSLLCTGRLHRKWLHLHQWQRLACWDWFLSWKLPTAVASCALSHRSAPEGDGGLRDGIL